MAEYNYWHDRENGLSILVEQLKTTVVERIFLLLNKAKSQIPSGFNYYRTDLLKLFHEAADNVKFLYTITRHFKTMAESDNFKSITEQIPSLMEGLRMMWILSRYYCTEERMSPLFERIAWQLRQTVTKHLAVKRLFRQPIQLVLRRTNEAYDMLKQWKISYMTTREAIELSGKGARWEFDKGRLFKETEYIASVCKDLNKICNVLQDFHNIFGAELKAIMNNPEQIDGVIKRVDKLVVPVQQADFDFYTEFNKENWEVLMSSFYDEVSSLENEAKFFINDCFTVLISAEEAMQALLKFKNMKTRDAIQEQLLTKFDVVMQQFIREISGVGQIFNKGKRNPPLLRYHPPVAGGIFWERQLFHRLKRAVLKFQNVKELKNSELKILAFEKYLNIAKQMKLFEDTKYNQWIETACTTVESTLKKSVLTIVACERSKG
ncbi:dynein axonemal heavy chain 10-like [Athalia rosae]|uniref:dynein axonemal heavy chain 10-like n=1 Tax=Athalia rosae TaxID=37344 RepID=UPI00203410C7|nr:dynein axonemal heavy chain 10-like [Athalia rosae]